MKKIGGVTTLLGITFVGEQNKTVIRKDGSFVLNKYVNLSKNMFENVIFIRGIFKFLNMFKMMLGTWIGKAAAGFLSFAGLMFLIGKAFGESVVDTTANSIMSYDTFLWINILIFGLSIIYMIKIRGLHGLEHKIIICYNKNLDMTVENVKCQKKEVSGCGGTLLGIFILFQIAWVWILGLPAIYLVLLIPTAGYEVFLLAKGQKWYNKLFFMPGFLIQLLTTGNDVSDSDIKKYITGFVSFIKQEDAEYYNTKCHS